MKKYLVFVTAILTALMLVSLVPMTGVNAAARSDLDFVWYTEPDACFSALQAGTIDVMCFNSMSEGVPISYDGDNVDLIMKQGAVTDPNIQISSYTGNDMVEFDLNNNYTIDDYPTSLNPMSVTACRQAVAFLVDKNYIIATTLSFYGARIDVPVCYPQTVGWVNASVVTYDWNNNGVIEPSEDNYPYNYNPNQAAALLASIGFNDTDGNGYLNYPSTAMWLDAAGKDTTEMPLEVCARSDDSSRLAAGRLLDTALTTTLGAATWPSGYVGGGFATTGTTWQQPRVVLSPKVMGARNYHIYTGGWSFGRFPTYLYNLFHSMFWYSYGANYVTGEGPSTPVGRILPHFAHPGLDTLVDGVYLAGSFSAAQTASLKATGYLVQYCVNIPLWSSLSYVVWRKILTGVVNAKGYGIVNPFTLLNAYKVDHTTINIGLVSTWDILNPLYSSSICENAVLQRIYPSLIEANPYDLAVDLPWVAQDWTVGTWVDRRDGITKTAATYYLRKDVGGAAPQTGTSVGYFSAKDYEFTVWYNYRYDDSWQWADFKDVNHVEVINPYTVKVYFDYLSYWLLYAPTYPLLGPASTLEPLLCLATGSTFYGSALTATGGDPSYFEYQFTTECIVNVVSATKNGWPMTEGVDFYIRGGYDVSPLHSVFVNLTTIEPTDIVSIEYYYAIPGGAGGTYLGGNLYNDWTDTMYAYGTHYPVYLSSTTAAMNKNPYFFLSPILGEVDWRWTTAGTSYPHSGYFQINILDVVKCTAGYCTRGDEEYNPRYFPGADLDASDLCHVGILDLVTICGVYGQKFGIPTA